MILSDRSATGARTALAQQGPALALRFHLLAALFAVLLAAGGIGLVATVDRGRRVEDLAALRYQGVRAGPVGRAARWGYLAIVLAALAVGLAAAAVAWWVSGWALPVFVDAAADWPVPRWPRPVPVLWPVLAAGVALLGTGWLVAARLNRAIRRRVEGAT